VAIKRHEFLPQSRVAPAAHESEVARSLEPTSLWPSLIAQVRGATARSAVRHAQRPSRVAQPTAAASSLDNLFASRHLRAFQRDTVAWASLHWSVSSLMRTPAYARLLEAA
jgi:hypothetical protein